MSEYVHYQVYNKTGKMLADGEGNKGRFQTILKASSGQVPTTKHMKSFPLYMAAINGQIDTILCDEYETKEAAFQAEQNSHKVNGRPTCQALIKQAIDDRCETLNITVADIYRSYPFTAGILSSIQMNGDMFVNSYLKAHKARMVDYGLTTELEFFDKFFALDAK